MNEFKQRISPEIWSPPINQVILKVSYLFSYSFHLWRGMPTAAQELHLLVTQSWPYKMLGNYLGYF